MSEGVRVWDLPTRLFHWLLVILFGFSWWSAETGLMDWHRLSGPVLIGLLLFRILWGFVGGSTARFASFVRSPSAVMAYVRGTATPAPGHNPLGGLSVIAMLAMLTAQAGSGLFATDIDGLESGPLSFLIAFDASRIAAEIHEISFNIFLTLIVLHLLTILYYLLRRNNLIAPMISGRSRRVTPDFHGLKPARQLIFPAVAVIAAFIAWATSKGFWL